MDLKAARKAARYSQKAVAELLGVSPPTYIRMERDPESVTIEDARKLAKLFAVDIDELFFSKQV